MTTTVPSGDPYYKKTIALRVYGRTLELDVAHDLFSGHDIDAGTRLLLRSLATQEHEHRSSVVDLGCGYGPLGLGLKVLVPNRSLDLVDRDSLAIAYSRRNAERNGMPDARAYASLGWNDVRGDGFDLAVCNIPAKAGERAIRHFLLDVRQYLAPSGLVAIVVVARLDDMVRGLLTESAEVEVLFSKRVAGYSVYHYGFTAAGLPKSEAPEDPLGVFERGTIETDFRGLQYKLRTAYSLPEFDTLGYETELIAERLLALRRPPRHLLVFNPGQGHLPVLVWKHLEPERVTLAGRDLLALRYSRANTAANGCPSERLKLLHEVRVEPADTEDVDLALAVLRERQPAAVSEFEIRALAQGLRPRARLLVGGSSTAITRLESAFARDRVVRIVGRKRNKGHSVLEMVA
ncbi:methyltransferase [Candidatus Nephthysia bennettiae]|uniref:Methyltransferase n=1 Tax=Candidatus Nephthysia bennettiae TaxID=3127016 RepID=A0A934K4I4_9BACT|nr:methyltransferase [Candidatus Dormibacteraeota bacterium]MBJ7615029.1 methyltransferase [Candidatus Dormibacteraeota bacterium]